MKNNTTKVLPINTHIIRIIIGMSGLTLIALIIQLTR